MYVMQQGGARRRPGSIFLRSTIDSTKKSRLIPFVFSSNEVNIIEISPTTPYIRAIYPAGTVATVGLPASVTTGFQNANAYLEAELDEIQYQQIADLLYLTHPNHEPLVIARTAAGVFSSYMYFDAPANTTVAINDRFTFREENITAITLTGSATTGTITVTASAALFASTMIGSVWRKTNGGTTGYFVITAYASTTSVTALVLVTIDAAAIATWAEGAWSDYRGYPRAISYYQKRLYYGGSASKPDTFWASASGLFTKLRAPSSPAAADPFSDLITSSPYVNLINWMSVQKKMVMGTLGAEHVVEGFDTTAAISSANPANINADTIYGSVSRQALRYDNVLAFIHRAGKKIIELAFNFQEDQFAATDIGLLADHLTDKQFYRVFDGVHLFSSYNQIVWQSDNNLIWIMDFNGGLFTCTRDKVAQVAGFAFHKIAGESTTYGPAMVRSVCVIPPISGSSSLIPETEQQDTVFLCVERTLGGAVYCSIERLSYNQDHEINPPDEITFQLWPVYSDSAVLKEYSENDSTLFAGFDHLVGSTVSVLADGIYQGEIAVQSSGELITDGGAEGNSLPSAYAAYKDAAASTPVDGTGGSPSCTLTVTSTAPLVGTYSYLFARPASNVQGEGFHINFTVSADDRDKVMKLTFVTNITGGIDYPTIFIYNVDTAEFLEITRFTPTFRYYTGTAALSGGDGLLTSAPDSIDGQQGNAEIYYLFKVDDSSTNYRIIFHIPVTTATAINYKFDSISVQADGCIELPIAAKRMIGGLGYESTIKTLKTEAGSVIGSAAMLPKRIEKVGIRFFNTVGATFGRESGDLESIPFRPTTLAMDAPIPVFTGDKIVDFPTNWDRDGQIIIKQALPLPMTVLGISKRGVTNE